MTLPHSPAGLSEIASDYDILLCDVWGVIHNGRESWPEACEALARFNLEGGQVVLISNSPRPASDVIAQLDHLGVPRASWQAFVTSGDATRAELSKLAPGPVWIIGPERDNILYEGLGQTQAISAEDAAFLSVTGLLDDETETPEDYRERFVAPAARAGSMRPSSPLAASPWMPWAMNRQSSACWAAPSTSVMTPSPMQSTRERSTGRPSSFSASARARA